MTLSYFVLSLSSGPQFIIKIMIKKKNYIRDGNIYETFSPWSYIMLWGKYIIMVGDRWILASSCLHHACCAYSLCLQVSNSRLERITGVDPGLPGEVSHGHFSFRSVWIQRSLGDWKKEDSTYRYQGVVSLYRKSWGPDRAINSAKSVSRIVDFCWG